MSHPSRVRGLKLIQEYQILQPFLQVAPFTGAWIEILLKKLFYCLRTVAPFTGAWIEIHGITEFAILPGVAPFTGAWIEI